MMNGGAKNQAVNSSYVLMRQVSAGIFNQPHLQKKKKKFLWSNYEKLNAFSCLPATISLINIIEDKIVVLQ